MGAPFRSGVVLPPAPQQHGESTECLQYPLQRSGVEISLGGAHGQTVQGGNPRPLVGQSKNG